MKPPSLPPLQQLPKNWAMQTSAQYFFIRELSGFPAADLKCRQMGGDVAGVKRRPGKGADGVGRAGRLALMPHSGIIEVRPEDAHGGPERVRPHRRLPPAHHLRV